MRQYGISNMELSFTSIGCGLDRSKLEEAGFQRAGYRSFKQNGFYSYMIARSNITVYHDLYDYTSSIKQNIKESLQYLFDEGIIKEYNYQQGIVSLTHYMIVDIPTTEPIMDVAGCREAMETITVPRDDSRFSIIYKFKIGANKKLINHPTPTANISKSLASLHKINILSKGSNLEIKAIFSLNNSSSKGNNKFIKNSLHYRIISDIIDDSINNLLGNND